MGGVSCLVVKKERQVRGRVLSGADRRENGVEAVEMK